MKRLRLSVPFFIVYLASHVVVAQIGGKNAFDFVNLASNAKLGGIGGINVSSRDYDPNMIFSNPALLNSTMVGRASLSIMPYMAGIASSQASGVFAINRAGIFGAGLQYINYGSAKSTDASGNDLGIVSAGEYAFTATHSRTIENYTLGASVKFAGSQIAGREAYALMLDMGAVYKHPKRDFTVGLVAKNIGFALKNYQPGTAATMPLDVQLGMSYKLEHLPLRFSITVHHLHQYKIAYDDPSKVSSYDINGNPVRESVSVADNIAQHFVFGGEFLLAKGFNIRAGYNHMLRRDTRLANEIGLGGFMGGFMLRIKAIEIAYSHGWYHAAGGSNIFTLIVNTSGFYKKAEIPAEIPATN